MFLSFCLAKPHHKFIRFFSQGKVESKLKAMGVTLPPLPAPQGSYMNYVQTGNLIFLAGHLPKQADGTFIKGRLGENMTAEQGAAYVLRWDLAPMRARVRACLYVYVCMYMRGIMNFTHILCMCRRNLASVLPD